MKRIVILLVFFLTACNAGIREDLTKTLEYPIDYLKSKQISKAEHPVATAIAYINFSEKNNRKELKTLLGIDPVYYEWCAAFVNAVLEESGYQSNKNHPNPLLARSFLEWGIQIKPGEIKSGDIVIFPRGAEIWQGHVGFFIRAEKINNVEHYYILGGNQSNRVSIERFRANTALGIRRAITPISQTY